MAITRQTPQVEISNAIVASTNNLNGAIIHSMEVAGQQGTNEARAHGEYTDQTGSLRSSTGDVISDDGVIISSSSFETVKNGSEGSVKGKSLAKSIAESIKGKKALVLVAGMDYAPYLQAKGRKVMGDAEEIIKRSLTKQFKDLGLIK